MDEAIAPERLSEIIRLIYDCATDPAQWPVAMEAIRPALNFHNASLDLLLLPSCGRIMDQAKHGEDTSVLSLQTNGIRRRVDLMQVATRWLSANGHKPSGCTDPISDIQAALPTHQLQPLIHVDITALAGHRIHSLDVSEGW
ncbi:hypothetical protein HL653_20935 [Sphingomonas sp. AP4-R1]|uniref:hypothetical protein n=1 Tax=Sphingomonas sp. AP4-R1 TaxID=2735134 RepID=UPI00149354CB|nr:hypothetical protein [Sphingomonas sp. AP4-R1]QJU59879.1 hypothetical protein HL653_20935 [Sphingomonas sp. AP4-R1]